MDRDRQLQDNDFYMNIMNIMNHDGNNNSHCDNCYVKTKHIRNIKTHMKQICNPNKSHNIKWSHILNIDNFKHCISINFNFTPLDVSPQKKCACVSSLYEYLYTSLLSH